MIYKSEASLLKEPIKEFFDIALGEYDVTEFVLLAQLAGALDVLSAQYHSLPNCEPDNESDPPDSPHEEYVRLYHRAAARFPLLGYYPYIEPKGDIGEEVFLGDAIDDIADIARDLSTVVWYMDQNRPASAIWDFRFGYQSHWGEHLLRLRHVIHHKLHY